MEHILIGKILPSHELTITRKTPYILSWFDEEGNLVDTNPAKDNLLGDNKNKISKTA